LTFFIVPLSSFSSVFMFVSLIIVLLSPLFLFFTLSVFRHLTSFFIVPYSSLSIVRHFLLSPLPSRLSIPMFRHCPSRSFITVLLSSLFIFYHCTSFFIVSFCHCPSSVIVHLSSLSILRHDPYVLIVPFSLLSVLVYCLSLTVVLFSFFIEPTWLCVVIVF